MANRERRVNREGFWWSKHDRKLPKPIEQEKAWFGERFFLKALTSVESKLGARHQKGSSTCRCCGITNGSAEYVTDEWRWPSGLMHYIKVHHVRPSLAFQDYIESKYAQKQKKD